VKIQQNVEHPTQRIEVETVTIETADDLIELRNSDWHDGQLALLTYPTAPPVGFIGVDNPKYFGGHQVNIGDTILKGPAGDFEVLPQGTWEP
jgi:hypothetical protein